MKKWIANAAIILGMVSVSGIGVLATDVVGTNMGNIPVKGQIGADNTDPDSPLPEGDMDWINVNVPTDAIFIGSKSTSAITSPKYDITNNSGRPVDVMLAGFDSQAPGDLSAIGSLNVNLLTSEGVTEPVIIAGAAIGTINPTSPVKLASLANIDGALVKGGETDNLKAVSYSFTGDYDVADVAGTTSVTEDYIMTLKFEVPTAW